jgi:hypothetical protein
VWVDARFDVFRYVATTYHWVKDGANGSTDDEVRTLGVESIGLDGPVTYKLPLESGIELLHHRVLQVVVDDGDATSKSTTDGNRTEEPESKTLERFDSRTFNTSISAPGRQVLIFLGSAAGPPNNHPIDAVAFSKPEGLR